MKEKQTNNEQTHATLIYRIKNKHRRDKHQKHKTYKQTHWAII